MTQQEGQKPISSTIETLERAEGAGAVVLRGTVFEETGDAITIQVGSSLLEIPRVSVREIREVGSEDGKRSAEVAVAPDATIVQRVLTTAESIIGRRAGGNGSGACQCACQCNCACDCACSSLPELRQVIEATFRQSAFRQRV